MVEYVKTYDAAGNLSEETYIETHDGELIEVPPTKLSELNKVSESMDLRRVYFELK